VIVDRPTSELLAASTRFADIRELAVVDSTNRYLLDLARRGAPDGVVVVADYQSAGRGRLGRSWEASPGAALLASILLRPDRDTLAPDRRWLAAAAVALAGAEACGPNVEIKWPNDLLLGDRKLAGILAEADAGAIVVGIGINVASAPPGATWLEVAGEGRTHVDRGQLLAALLTNLERWCDRWDDVASAYRARCATIGRQVRLELPDGTSVVGQATAVAPDGGLRVRARNGELAFHAADVIHVTGP
jgi:BirA family biotin operon repressor/biotin-[acetyl-CoA-carboxylase] ligase